MKNGVTAAGHGRSAWVVGDLYTVKASGKDTGGAFCLIETWVPPGSGPPPHLHQNEDEAFYIIEGEFQVFADGQELAAGPGAWVQLARRSTHHFRNVGDSPGKLLILATPAGLDEFFLEAGTVASDRRPDLSKPDQPDVQRLLAIAPKYGIEIKLPGSKSDG